MQKKGYKSLHNSGYWTGRDFLGFGPSAFSYFENKRFQNICNLEKYSQALKKNSSPIGFEESLAYPHNINELLALNLRLIEGIDVDEFEKKFNKIPLQTLQILKKSAFASFINNKIKLNKKGLLFFDSLAAEII